MTQVLIRRAGLITLLSGALLSGSLVAQTASAQSAQPTLTEFSNQSISFLYPESWATLQLPSLYDDVYLENDRTLFDKMQSPLTGDQIIVIVETGATARQRLYSENASGNALSALKTHAKSGESGTTYDIPQAIHLLNTSDAAQVTAKDIKTGDDELVILLFLGDQPVFIEGRTAAGQGNADQLLIDGLASTIQPGSAIHAATPTASVLSQTFKNSVYTVNYPAGWLTRDNSSTPEAIYLSTNQSLLDQANQGNFTLTDNQILVGLDSGKDLTNIIGTNTATLGDELKYAVNQMSSQFVSFSVSLSVSIGTQNGLEKTFTLKNGGGEGILILFGSPADPVLLVGLTAKGKSPANRALFEQIAASMVRSGS